MSFYDVYKDYLMYAKSRHKKQGFEAISQKFKLHILPYFMSKKISDICIEDILEWEKIILSKNYSNSQNNTLYCIFKSFFDYCVLIDLVDVNYVQSVGNFPKKFECHDYHVYTLHEFRKFRKNLDNFIDRQFFTFMYFYGTRPSEAMGLRFCDLENFEIHIVHSIHRRGKRELDTPKNQSSIRTIKISLLMKIRIWLLKCYYLKDCENINDYFIFGGKNPLSSSTLDRHKLKACRKCNLIPITQHEFRHSYVTRMINKKVPIDVVSRSVGHSRVSTTLDTYLHSRIKKKNVYDTLFRSKIFLFFENRLENLATFIITKIM